MAEAQAKNNETLTMAIPAGSDRQLNSVLEALMKKIDSMAEDIRGIKQALDDLTKREPDDLTKREPDDIYHTPQNFFHNMMLARMTHMMPGRMSPHISEEFGQPDLSESDRQDMVIRMRGPTLSGWAHQDLDDPAEANDIPTDLLDLLRDKIESGWDGAERNESDESDLLRSIGELNDINEYPEETEESILDAIKSRGDLFGMLIPHADPELFKAISTVRPDVVEVTEVEVVEVVEPAVEVVEPAVEVVEPAVEVVEPAVEVVEPAVVEPAELPPAPKKTRKKKDPADVKPRGRKKQN